MQEEPAITTGAATSAKDSRPRTRRRNAGRRAGEHSGQHASILHSGGRYAPLDQFAVDDIHSAAIELLQTVGIAGAPERVLQLVLAHGGRLLTNNRLSLPASLVDRAVDGLRRDITLCGQTSAHDLQLSGRRVHVGTGGAAPLVVDLGSGSYRHATLKDLSDAARVVDTLPHIQFFSRSMVATEIEQPLALDINTAYASLAGTTKHVMVSASHTTSVEAIAEMCFTLAGSKQEFTERPFLSLQINHAVPPMRFDADACDVLVAAARLGLPVQVNTFGQMGASSPVTIAGCVAQTSAETLAGMVIAWLANPDVAAVFGPRPMVTDLRTGGMAGGAGEQALLTAASVQMAHHYGFGCSTIAGATDSKIADAQSGYEKCLSVTLAAQAGCNLITQASGMQAGLMACSLESYLIDNDMLGAILRSLAQVEVSADTLNTEITSEVVNGEGHYLGRAETLQRMQSDFLYPGIADRSDHEAWAASGSKDIRTIANQRVQALLQSHYPSHIPSAVDKALRNRFEIRLPPLKGAEGC